MACTKIVEYQRSEFNNKIDKLLEYIVDTRKLDRQDTNKVQRQDLCVEIYKVLGFKYLNSEFIDRLILSACVLALDCSLPLSYVGNTPPSMNPQKRSTIDQNRVTIQTGSFVGSELNTSAKNARKSRILTDAIPVDNKTSSVAGTVYEDQASSINSKQSASGPISSRSIGANMTRTLPELDLPNPLLFNIYSIKSLEARDSILTYVILPAIYAQLPLLRYIVDRFISFISTLYVKCKQSASVNGVENNEVATSTLLVTASSKDQFYYSSHFSFLLSIHFRKIKAVDHLLCLLVNSAILVRETSINTAWEAVEKSRDALMQQCIVSFYTYLVLEHHAPASMCTSMGRNHSRLTVVTIGKVIASLLLLDIRTLLYSGIFLIDSCHRLDLHFSSTGAQCFNSLIRVVRSFLLWLDQDGKVELIRGNSSSLLAETKDICPKAITSTVVHMSRKTVRNKERKRLLSYLLFNIILHTLGATVNDFSAVTRSHSASWKACYTHANSQIHSSLVPNKCLQYEKVCTNTFEKIQDDAHVIVYELLQNRPTGPKLSNQYISLIQAFSTDPDNSELYCNGQKIESSAVSRAASLLSEEVVSRCIRDVYYYNDEYTYIIEMCTCVDAFMTFMNPKDKLHMPINASTESQRVLPLNHPVLHLWGPSPSHSEMFLCNIIYSVEILRIILIRAKVEASFTELLGDFADVLYTTVFQSITTMLLAVESLVNIPDDFLERKSKVSNQLPTARYLVEISTRDLLTEGIRSVYTEEAVRILSALVASGPMYEVPAALILLEVVRILQVQSLSQTDKKTLTKRYISPLTEAIVKYILLIPEGKSEINVKLNALGSISRILAHCFELPPSSFSQYNLP